MVRIRVGNMIDVWNYVRVIPIKAVPDNPPVHQVLLFTANSVLTHDNSLVMGAGAAKQFRDRFPDLPLLLGKKLKDCIVYDDDFYNSQFNCRVLTKPYGVAITRPSKLYDMAASVGAFQTKYHYADKSTLGLIEYSFEQLRTKMRTFVTPVEVHLNFPGIGLGGLKPDDVFRLLYTLDGLDFDTYMDDDEPDGPSLLPWINLNLWVRSVDDLRGRCSTPWNNYFNIPGWPATAIYEEDVDEDSTGD